MRDRLLHTAFVTALLSYLGFLFVDYREPGFVSDVFSVHCIGALALVMGLLWYRSASRTLHTGKVVPFVLGLVAAVVVWNEGALFGDFRILLTTSVLILPFFAAKALSRST